MTASDDDKNDAAAPAVLILDGVPLVLDRHLADGFGVTLSALNQAVARNEDKFDERHAFRLTIDQRDFLRSLGVIPKPKGRGGSHTPPMVYTQKGVARLATILTSDTALEFTDSMIDLSIEVHRQLAQGNNTPTITQPSRFIGAPEDETDLTAIRKLRRKLVGDIGKLMETRIGDSGPTIGEGLSESAHGLYDDLKARLKTRTLENDKLVAETMLILEEITDKREKRHRTARRADLEDEALHLDNVKRRIDLIRDQVALLKEMEPPAIARLNQTFLPGAAQVLQLPAPQESMKK